MKIWKSVVWMLISTVAFPPQALALVCGPTSAPSLTRKLEKLRDASASRFDVQSILDQAAYDHEQLIDFVRNEIRFRPARRFPKRRSSRSWDWA